VALWHLLQAVRRQFLIVVVGAVLTMAALVHVHGRPGLYQTGMDIAVRPPYLVLNKNPYLGRDYGLIATAGVLAKMARPSGDSAMTASSSVTLAGRGITDGYEVSLPNRGGQWAFDYDRPILGVQAVGRTQERAQANLDAAVQAVRGSLARLQDEARVPQNRRITLDLNPPQPLIGYSHGRPSRALGATVLLGLTGSLSAVVLVDGRRTRRRGDRVERGTPSPNPART
jgi:hypothetical protein